MGKKIKLLGISASPRKSGNSWFLLERASAAARNAAPESLECELYSFAGKKMEPCISCFKCLDKKDCIREDGFHDLRDKWEAADAIIYSVPVYHMGLPGQFKCFIDRLGNTTYAKHNHSPKYLKIIGNLVQGGSIFAGQEQVLTALINHSILMSCLPVGGDLWQCYIGAAGWTRNSLDTDSLSQLYQEGEEDAQAVVVGAESVGKRVVQIAQIVKSGGEACYDALAKDDIYSHFLDRVRN
jgi:multimeric flavodoxin WrbA